MSLREWRIIERSDGPRIEGTRISVYLIYEDLQNGHSREWIAAMLGISSFQVQAAMDYIDEHREEVAATYEKIMERIRKGNPPEIEEKLDRAREKMHKWMAERQEIRQEEAEPHAEAHGG